METSYKMIALLIAKYKLPYTIGKFIAKPWLSTDFRTVLNKKKNVIKLQSNDTNRSIINEESKKWSTICRIK